MLQQVSKMELTFSAIMEVLVISTEIGSVHGSANGGPVGAESGAWDSSPAPKVDWDAMLDSCGRTGLES